LGLFPPVRFKRLDFPAPLGPSRATTSPEATLNETSHNTNISPNFLVTFSTEILSINLFNSLFRMRKVRGPEGVENIGWPDACFVKYWTLVKSKYMHEKSFYKFPNFLHHYKIIRPDEEK